MCGRFAFGGDRDAILQHAVDEADVSADGEWVDREAFYPRYNIAPRSRAPCVRQRPRTEGVDEPRENILQTMRWGVVPHYAKADVSANTTNTINARSETLLESSTGIWASLKATKRCIVPCDGYFEWLTKGKQKLPHFVRNEDPEKKLYLAGLWDCVVLDESPLYTFAIVTTDSRGDMDWLHDRMPVIFEAGSDEMKLWLDSSIGWTPEIRALLRPYKHALTIYQVPTEVGRVGSDSPTFIQPVKERSDGIKAMFARQKSPHKQEPTPFPSKPKQDVAPTPNKRRLSNGDDSPTPASTSTPNKRRKPNNPKSPVKPSKVQSAEITSFFSPKRE